MSNGIEDLELAAADRSRRRRRTAPPLRTAASAGGHHPATSAGILDVVQYHQPVPVGLLRPGQDLARVRLQVLAGAARQAQIGGGLGISGDHRCGVRSDRHTSTWSPLARAVRA